MIEYLSRYQGELADIDPADLTVATRVLKGFLAGPDQQCGGLHIADHAPGVGTNFIS